MIEAWMTRGGRETLQGRTLRQYTTVRNFYERIRAAEQAPVVLAKK